MSEGTLLSLSGIEQEIKQLDLNNLITKGKEAKVDGELTLDKTAFYRNSKSPKTKIEKEGGTEEMERQREWGQEKNKIE